MPLSQFANIPFPLEYPVLTAFYATVDIRGVGNIYYRDTTDKKLLERATREIHQAFPTSSLEFSTSNLIIATWFRVGYFNQGTDKVGFFLFLCLFSFFKLFKCQYILKFVFFLEIVIQIIFSFLGKHVSGCYCDKRDRIVCGIFVRR